jgi:hypothetical protein
VDAIKDAVIEDSNEFLKQRNESSIIFHKRKASNRAYNLYQSPKLFVMNPSSFLRRNNSEQKQNFNPSVKGSARASFVKPLSLMSSMKKFEIEPEDIVKKDFKLRMPKNLLKSKLFPTFYRFFSERYFYSKFVL